MTRIFHLFPPAAAGRNTLIGVGVYLIGQALVLLWIGSAFGALVSAACAALIFYVSWSMRRVTLILSPDYLQIQGDLYGRTLPRSALQIQEAREISLAMDTAHAPTWRTWGTGVPGYLAGWFRLRNGEKALAYITDRTHVVYLPTTRGFSVLLSVSEPNTFLQALREPIS